GAAGNGGNGGEGGAGSGGGLEHGAGEWLLLNTTIAYNHALGGGGGGSGLRGVPGYIGWNSPTDGGTNGSSGAAGLATGGGLAARAGATAPNDHRLLQTNAPPHQGRESPDRDGRPCARG